MREGALCFLYVIFVSGSVPKREASETANRMEHSFQWIDRFSFINVTHKTVDEPCIPVGAQ
jgi:hypothetical protein